MRNMNKEAFGRGFLDRCAEDGISPEMLVKVADRWGGGAVGEDEYPYPWEEATLRELNERQPISAEVPAVPAGRSVGAKLQGGKAIGGQPKTPLAGIQTGEQPFPAGATVQNPTAGIPSRADENKGPGYGTVPASSPPPVVGPVSPLTPGMRQGWTERMKTPEAYGMKGMNFTPATEAGKLGRFSANTKPKPDTYQVGVGMLNQLGTVGGIAPNLGTPPPVTKSTPYGNTTVRNPMYRPPGLEVGGARVPANYGGVLYGGKRAAALQGFLAKCAEEGVDPEMLVKLALQTGNTALDDLTKRDALTNQTQNVGLQNPFAPKPPIGSTRASTEQTTAAQPTVVPDSGYTGVTEPYMQATNFGASPGVKRLKTAPAPLTQNTTQAGYLTGQTHGIAGLPNPAAPGTAPTGKPAPIAAPKKPVAGLTAQAPAPITGLDEHGELRAPSLPVQRYQRQYSSLPSQGTMTAAYSAGEPEGGWRTPTPAAPDTRSRADILASANKTLDNRSWFSPQQRQAYEQYQYDRARMTSSPNYQQY